MATAPQSLPTDADLDAFNSSYGGSAAYQTSVFAGNPATFLLRQWEFDLTKVNDANGNGPTYKYSTAAVSYSKEFDNYWPSQFAPQLLAAFESQLQTLKQDCTTKAQRVFALTCDVYGTGTSNGCSGALVGNDATKELVSLTKSCEKDLDIYAKQLSTKIPAEFKYGVSPELQHNMISVADADGRIIVANMFGNDPSDPSFDRVTQQDHGGGTTTYQYRDLTHHLPISTIPDRFVALTICPRIGGAFGPIQEMDGMMPNSQQVPSLSIISVGPMSRTAFQYIDAVGRTLRKIDPSGLDFDFNYGEAGLIGLVRPNKGRTCLDYDTRARITQRTDLPASNAQGEVLKTQLQYDAVGGLTRKTDIAGSQTVADTTIIRDQLERVVGYGEGISDTSTRWTCFGYTDFYRATIPLGSSAAARKRSTKASSANLLSLNGKTGVRPCSQYLSQAPILGIATQYASLPSTIQKPSGSITQFKNILAAGPQEVVSDATGPSPVQRYFVYTDLGYLAETGLRDAGTADKIAGSVMTWDPDTTGLVHASTVPDATNYAAVISTSYTFDKSGNLQTVIDPRLSRKYVVDKYGRTTSLVETPTGADGATGLPRAHCWGYDSYGELVQEISPNGVVSELAYDPSGRVTDVTKGALEIILPSSYAPCSPMLSTLRATPMRESVLHQEYDSGGQLATRVQDGVALKYSYDGQGRLIDTFVPARLVAERGPNGKIGPAHVIGFHHSTNFLGANPTWEAILDEYPSEGILPGSPQPGMHAVMEFSHDLVGRTTFVARWNFQEQSLGSGWDKKITAISYDDPLNESQVIDDNSETSTFRLDGLDRLSEMYVGKGEASQIHTTIQYANGGSTQNVTSSPAPTFSGTHIRVTATSPLGNLIGISEDGRTVLARTLDRFGRLHSLVSLDDVGSTYQFDAYDELISVQRQGADGSDYYAGLFSWDPDGNIKMITDGAGNATVRSYDALDRLATLVNGLGSTVYTYAPGTRLVASITSPQANISNSYDLSGNVAQSSVKDGDGRDEAGNRAFDYSALGQITSATNTGTTLSVDMVTMSYDSLGRRIVESDSQLPYSVHRSYGVRSQTTTLTPTLVASNIAGGSVSRSFDALGRKSSLEINGEPVATWAYIGDDILSIQYGDGSMLHRSFDALGRSVSSQVMSGSVITARVDRSLGPDDVPHQVTLTANGQPLDTHFYQTDGSARLVGEQEIVGGPAIPPQSQDNAGVLALFTSDASRYQLDGAGNWLTVTGASPIHTTVDGANRYSAVNGAVAQFVAGGGVQSFGTLSYRWDGLDQLTTASTAGGSDTWQRDAFGRSNKSSNGAGTTTLHIWDGDQRIGDVAANGGLSIYGGFTEQDVVAVAGANGNAAIYHDVDHSVFALSKGQAGLQQLYSYTAYGKPRAFAASNSAPISSFASPYLFQGIRYDVDVDLYEMGVRPYSADFGRFLSPDPIGQLGGLNLFQFSGDMPLSVSDPRGTNGQPNRSSDSGPTSMELPRIPGMTPLLIGPIVGENRLWEEGKGLNPYGRVGNQGPLPQQDPGIHSTTSLRGYDYHQDRILGQYPTSSAPYFALVAMQELQADPNRFFDFRVIGLNGERGIQLGSIYNLANQEGRHFPLPPIGGSLFPIQVTEVTPTSFTFTTLPGHFDAPGSTITFRTAVADDGSVHLEHFGVTNDSATRKLQYLVGPDFAGLAWDIQAANLRKWLDGLK